MLVKNNKTNKLFCIRSQIYMYKHNNNISESLIASREGKKGESEKRAIYV